MNWKHSTVKHNLLVLLLLLASACQVATPAAGAVNVKIQNFAYSPTPLTIPIGTKVIWTQYDQAAPHTVTSGMPNAPDAGAVFDSPTLTTQKDSTFPFTFTKPGIYPYFCRFHLEMLATVVVQNPDGSVPTSVPAQAAATPTALVLPPPSNAQVIAEGLINPRGFAFGPDGALYVAEAGTRPAASSSPTPGGANTPAARGAVNPICESALPSYDKAAAGCPGATGPQINNNGRISRIALDGTRTTVADHLPVTVGPFNDVFGINAVAFVGSELYAAIAAGATRGHPDFATGVYKVNRDGTVTLIANLEAFQKANPPKFIPEDYNYSLPYDMVELNGKLYIADGNASVIFEVDPAAPATNNVRRLADMSVGHPVTTGIAAGADGNVYVTNFTPGPYPPGGAKIWKITSSGQLSAAASGLSLGTGLAVGSDGTFYVAEFATALGKPPYIAPPGRIIKIGADGKIAPVASPLVYPTALRWAKDGLYTTNNSVNNTSEASARGAIYRINLAP